MSEPHKKNPRNRSLVDTNRWVVKSVIALALLIALGILYPAAQANGVILFGSVLNDLKILAHTNLEDRKVLAYGDLSGLGYGYLRKIVSDLPDPKIFPVTRYKNYSRNAHLLFPGRRTKIDDRILVGIDLADNDLREIPLANAFPIPSGKLPPHVYAGAFVTIQDYDSLTGFRLQFKPPLRPVPLNIQITLVHSPENKTNLGKWTWTNLPGTSPVTCRLPEPMTHFSFSRGTTPFILLVETIAPAGEPPPEITGVEILGVKIDLRGYTILQRNQNCFAAVKNDFLARIAAENLVPWKRYVERIKNA